MTRALIFAGRKLLALAVSIFLLSAAVFCIARLAPGDPLVSYYGDHAEKMTPEERTQAEERLGLHDPLHTQYIRWLSLALQGEFGISYKYKTDVLEVIRNRIGNTLLLGGLGFLFIFTAAPLLGIFCAWREDSLPDRLLCGLGTVTSCIPEFWLSLLLILIFSLHLHLLPSSGAYSTGMEGSWADRAVHLILPLTVVVLSHLWYYAYLVRNKLLEEIRADYVILAKAKGLKKGNIFLRHCARNLMPSYLSIMAVSVSHILGGTYMVETVFSYPGIGTLAYESARFHDYNLLMVLCILSGAAVIFCNIIAQAISERIDPRMKRNHGAENPGVTELGG